MKRVMIRCDVEGVSGVVSYRQSEPGSAEFAWAQRWFMADLLAAVNGLLQGGVQEIVIYDEHYYGRNIDIEQLPHGVRAICGKPPYRADWAGGLDDSFDGLVLLGLHSKYGTPGGLLHHSYELDIRDLLLNGQSVGEIGMETAIAGDYGVPLVMLTGDTAAVVEATALVPGAVGVSVKESLGETGGCCLPLGESTALIQQAAEQVARNPPAVQPWQIDGPVRLTVRFNDGAYLNRLHELHAKDTSDQHTLELEEKSVTAAWARYWQMKLAVQRSLIN